LVEKLARLGYATKGAVYIIVGALATLAAFRAGGKTTDSEGVFQEVLSQPLGALLLWAIVVGLAGYALWRAAQSLVDTEGKGSDAKAIAIRGGYFISGLAHAGLALSAARIAMGSGGGGDRDERDWTARFLALPLGPLIVALFGAGLVLFGLYQIYKGYGRKFRKHLETRKMGDLELKWFSRIAQFGLAARGIVFGVMGLFLIRAAINYNPQEAGGLGRALRALENQTFGTWALAVVAAGLVAYGIYMLVEARYHRIIAE
jgi:multisubunit Na+/H+ antiporter MnhC subunit